MLIKEYPLLFPQTYNRFTAERQNVRYLHTYAPTHCNMKCATGCLSLVVIFSSAARVLRWALLWYVRPARVFLCRLAKFGTPRSFQVRFRHQIIAFKSHSYSALSRRIQVYRLSIGFYCDYEVMLPVYVSCSIASGVFLHLRSFAH